MPRFAYLYLALPLLWVAQPAWAQQRNVDSDLRALVAQLLPKVEELSGLSAQAPLHVTRRSRSDVKAFLAAELDDSHSPAELEGIAIAYQRLGLLPDTINLRHILVDLTAEQLAGYYDPRRDTLYILSDLPTHRLRPILVHEMVHALQDQHTPLDSLVGRQHTGDRQLAARAAIEGHATLVMFLFETEQEMGRIPRLEELPLLSHVPIELLLPNDPSPLLASAPAVLREGGIFPYMRGAGFVQQLWLREPVTPPFGDRLPRSTEQVLDPEGRFLGERDAPTEVILPVLSGDSASRWRPIYENTLGQFELSLLFKERHVQYGAEAFARGWDGDRYMVLSDGERNALVWYSVWDDARSAYRFAQAYRQIVGVRLQTDASVEELVIEGRPVVRILDAEVGTDLESIPDLPIRLVELHES